MNLFSEQLVQSFVGLAAPYSTIHTVAIKARLIPLLRAFLFSKELPRMAGQVGVS